MADNLRRQGGYIPGVRPGKQTQEELDSILLRLTAGGALYLSAVCILPEVLANFYNVPFYFGGTGLLIIVGVCMQTVVRLKDLCSLSDTMVSLVRRRNKAKVAEEHSSKSE